MTSLQHIVAYLALQITFDFPTAIYGYVSFIERKDGCISPRLRLTSLTLVASGSPRHRRS